MIRRSAAIGLAAFAFSLLVHFLGIALTLPDLSSQTASDVGVEQVALSDTFEDLAETRLDPVEPEFTEPPVPPVEPPPEPERVEAPTSQALVASDTPQNVAAPDRGAVQTPQPNVSAPVAPAPLDTPLPDDDAPDDGRDTAQATARTVVAPVGAEQAEIAQGSPEAAASATPPISDPVAPPTVTEPADTQAPASEQPAPDILAALPPDAVAPDLTLPSGDRDTEERAAAEDALGAVRPRARPETPSDQPFGTADGTADTTSGLQRPTELIESPLTAYNRDGTDVFPGSRRAARSSGALGPGNSTVTNYAGEVLMHLNRVPPVAVSGRGWARVVFRIDPDGSLAFVNIIDGSGRSEIEIAAKEHVRKGAPFPRPPGGNSRTLNFIYQIR